MTDAGENDISAPLRIQGGLAYWCAHAVAPAQGGSVFSAPLDGGPRALVGTFPGGGGNRGCSGFAIDSSSAYLPDYGAFTIVKVPLAGGSFTTLASGQTYPQHLSIDSTHVYWTVFPSGDVLRTGLDGGAVTTVVSRGGSDDFSHAVSDGNQVFVATHHRPSMALGSVLRRPLDAGAAVTIATNQDGASQIVVDATHVYWTNVGSTADYIGSVMKAPLDGGSPVLLASGQIFANSLALDSTHLYWTNQGNASNGYIGQVMAVPLAGGSPVVIADQQARPVGVAVDATSVYWIRGIAGQPRALVRKPKPGACGTFTATGSLATKRAGHAAVLLPSGEVLVAGGYYYSPTTILTSSERYNPVSGTWIDAGTLATPRLDFGMAVLPNGRVIAAGGRYGSSGNILTATSEIWDPATNSWSPGPNLAAGQRAIHFMQALPNGKVLIGLGYVAYPDCGYRRDAELYDPVANMWTLTGQLSTNREQAAVVMLNGGNVVAAGGGQNGCPSMNPGISLSEVYDVADGGWTTTGNLNRTRNQSTFTLLSDGRALIAGGSTSTGLTRIAELYNPATRSYSDTGQLSRERYYHAAALLPSGRVVVLGGTEGAMLVDTVELFDPSTGTWSNTRTPMITPRNIGTATVLLDGRVLVVGGHDATGNSTASVELFDETR